MGLTVNRLRLVFAYAILGTFLGSVALSAVTDRVHINGTLGAAFLIVAGFLFGPYITGRTSRDDDE